MTDKFLYFGYGGALNQSLVEFRVNSPVKMLGKGTLKDYALKFNRKNPDGTARGNLIPAEQDFTLGIIYEIDKNKFELLAQTEPEYVLTEFDILTDTDVIRAYAFICHHCEHGIFPTKKYMDSIIEYARLQNFPESYITKILSGLPKVTI